MMKPKSAVMLLTTLIFSLLLLGSVALAGVQKNDYLSNPGLEDPYVPYDVYDKFGRLWDLQVANGWEKFVIKEREGKLRYFTASDWAAFNGSPVVEKREGSQAQTWWSSKKFDCGVYQQVDGLTIGEHYGFSAGVLQVFEQTTSTQHDKMFRRVGIDPTGGTDPESDNVIWSPLEGRDVDWFYPSVGATALSSTMTVFVRVESTKDAATPHSNQVWVDDTYMDIAPTTILTLTPTNDDTAILASWSGGPRSGYHLFAYEAQYRPVTATEWLDLQVFDSSDDVLPLDTSKIFAAEKDVAYVVRARTWHEYGTDPNNNDYEVAGPWQTATLTIKTYEPVYLQGVTLSTQDIAMSDATVGVVGHVTSTISTGGRFSLETGAGTFAVTATTPAGWATSQPVWGQATTQTNASPVTLTLRAPNDVLRAGGGDFEGTLGPWQSDIPLTAANFEAANPRNGQYSLCLTETTALSFTTQVTGMYQPVLSLWHHVIDAQAGNVLTAEIILPDNLPLWPTLPITVTGNTSTWQFLSRDMAFNPIGTSVGTGIFDSNQNTYTGTLSLRLSVAQQAITPTTFCLDEVGLGGALGGPIRAYLPLILR